MNNPLITIIRLLFSLYIYCVFLRILFEWVRADRNNILTLSITRLTQPPLTYLGKFLPSAMPIKIQAIILIVVLELLKLFIVSMLYRLWPNFFGLLGWTIVDLVYQLITLYIYVFFIQIIFSWLMPKSATPISYIVYTLTYRILKIIRRFVPTIKGFDLSPAVAILLLQLCSSFVVNPLNQKFLQIALS